MIKNFVGLAALLASALSITREDQLITVLDIDRQEEVRNYKLMNDRLMFSFL